MTFFLLFTRLWAEKRTVSNCAPSFQIPWHAPAIAQYKATMERYRRYGNVMMTSQQYHNPAKKENVNYADKYPSLTVENRYRKNS